MINPTTLRVELSENPNMNPGVQEDTEIAVLHNLKLRGAFLMEGSTSQVELMTETPLLPNTRYSLITLAGAEGSIDFETPSELEGYRADNLMSMKDDDIESIEIIDAQTMIVSYRQELSALNYNYNLLAESDILEVVKTESETPELLLTLEPPLLPESNYILMFIELRDASGEMIDFDTGIYDFATEVFPESENTEGSSEYAETF